MVVKVLYIDDEIKPGRDAAKIRDLLQQPGEFECELRLPPADISSLSTMEVDALLVDLDLSAVPDILPNGDTPESNGKPVSYFGSSLAAEVRVRQPSCPIVLITRPQILGWKDQLFESSIDFDLIVLKDDINRHPDAVRSRIVALIDGFKALTSIGGAEWPHVVGLMKAEEEESKLLREASPPLAHGQWTVPQMARWLRNTIMGFPGILYDELTAATRLGISIESFRTQAVQDLMSTARYTGVFSTYKECWWRGRLFDKAQALMLENNITGSISQRFASAFSTAYKQTLTPAVCIYDETPIADWVCFLYQQPVKQQNSIPYYPDYLDSRPPVMDQARVSFKAIQEHPDFDENLVDADSYELVRRLWD